MSRFLKTMIVLLAIAAMVAPAMAEERLSLGGQMRVRGWYKDMDKKDNSTNTWADQRLRIGGKLSIAEGVSITFRTDITESNWGHGNTYGSGRDGSTQQWDRAHIDLAFDQFSLRAGQQFVMFSKSGAFNAQSNGLKIATKGDIPVTAFFMLQDDNDVTSNGQYVIDNKKTSPTYGTIIKSPENSNNSDGFYYGLNAGFGTDTFKGNAFGAAQKKVTNSDEEVYLIGLESTFNLDAFTVTGELDYFTGDANAKDDAFGTQAYVDVAFAINETVTVGGQAYYALGDKKDVQYAVLGNDFNGWDPLNEHGTGLNNEQITPNKSIFGTDSRPFAIFGNNAGVIAGRAYVDTKIGDNMTLGGSFSYLEPEEDANVKVDSAMNTTVGVHYNVMANTSIGAQVEYISLDQSSKAGKDAPEDAYAAGFGLFVNF